MTGSKSDTITKTGAAFSNGRRALWGGNPPVVLGFILNPLRIYVFDPALTINAILFPLALPSKLDPFFAKSFEFLCLPVLKCLYCIPPEKDPSMSSAARSTILHQPTMVPVKPPSDIQSAFIGSVSFLCSAIGDVAGILTNPKKFQGWVEALGQFNSFLESTGVADEMTEAIQKPLLRGR